MPELGNGTGVLHCFFPGGVGRSPGDLGRREEKSDGGQAWERFFRKQGMHLPGMGDKLGDQMVGGSMKFNWEPEEKEYYYRLAEKQLEDAGIDFVKVDRDQFGVRKWDRDRKIAEAIYIGLTPYPYRHFSNVRRGKLKRLGNWRCTDPKQPKPARGELREALVMMHSRLVYEDTGCRTEVRPKKRDSSGLSDGQIL